jgi:NADP-dependent 3-hydroxy acid dehydrogenase YdfG
MELKDKIVLITGSSQGIGAATAIEFAKEGAKVIVTYYSNKEKGEEILRTCEKLNDCLLVHLDIKDLNSIKSCVQNVVDKFGAVDILVNNAGVISWDDFVEQSVEVIENQVDVNVKGLMKMTKEVLPVMKGQGGGVVINVSSGAGKTAYSGLSVYCATKFAVRAFTQSLQKENNDIRFISVNPGSTATQMTNFRGVEPEKVAMIIVKSASERIKPDENRDVDVFKFL